MIACFSCELFRILCLTLPQNNTNTIMKAGVLNDVSLQTTDFSSLENLPNLAFVNEYFGMILNIEPYRDNFIIAVR